MICGGDIVTLDASGDAEPYDATSRAKKIEMLTGVSGALLGLACAIECVVASAGTDLTFSVDEPRYKALLGFKYVFYALGAALGCGALGAGAYLHKKANDIGRMSAFNPRQFWGRSTAKFALGSFATVGPVFALLHGCVVNTPNEYPGAEPSTQTFSSIGGVGLSVLGLLAACVSCCACVSMEPDDDERHRGVSRV
jgi:hypothetical protein